MLILGREEPEVASDIAEPDAAFVSEVEVMQYIFVATTDTFTVHSDGSRSGPSLLSSP
jgi:hypothetical protein